MLMTVLKGDLAVKQSKALIRTFKRMKDYIIENQNLIGETHIKRGYLVLNGQPFKAEIAYDEIYRQAKKSICIIDNYIGIKTLELLININPFIDFQKEYPNLQIKLCKSGGVFHDRYIILDYETEDEKIFLCGASSKDAGKRVATILEDVDKFAKNVRIETKVDSKFHEKFLDNIFHND